ncbi:HAUS augmin-like complex subunit 3 [Elysia marginata]|uniref:HAUS augmin-like complex subunit 3 n=1 Tax=Elysia marginata TaxID=1093978 RepID=A0AAV4GK70_9GAST|nr:HAUS augmin-like complex subunit 3 [Elysia marginata]
MDPNKFVQALHSIGYPHAHKLNPQALEWAYQNPATVSFLNWFSNSVGAENAVSAGDMQEFKAIEQINGLLERHQLEEALENVQQGSHGFENLESDVEKLKKSLAQITARKQAMLSHSSKIGTQQAALHDKIVKLGQVEEQASRSVKQAIDQCVTQDLKINEALKNLSAAVERLVELYKNKPEGRKGFHSEGYFLSQMNLALFHDAEAKYSHDLTAYTKKQFFEGVGLMSGEGLSAQYSLLDLSSPEKSVIADQEKEQLFMEDCTELQRLKQIFPRSECDRINALVNAKKAQSAVAEATALLESFKAGHFPSSPTEISHLKKSLEQKTYKATEEAKTILASLPDLLRKLGSLQGGEVLTGNYDLKLKRQNYFTEKQDQVISHLINQRARSEFLSLLYDLELQCHEETHVLLSAVGQLLTHHLKSWQQRMEDLEDPDFSEKKFQGSVVDARDTSTHRLFHLLGESEADKGLLCLQKQKVVQKAKHLHAQHTCTKAADQTMDEKYMNKVTQLESCLKECEEHLYAGSSTKSGQPMLSPSEIQEGIATLTSSLAALKKDVADIIVDVDKKKGVLKTNILQSKERELFTLFHTNPGKLEYIVNSLAERSKAQDIQ